MTGRVFDGILQVDPDIRIMVARQISTDLLDNVSRAICAQEIFFLTFSMLISSESSKIVVSWQCMANEVQKVRLDSSAFGDEPSVSRRSNLSNINKRINRMSRVMVIRALGACVLVNSKRTTRISACAVTRVKKEEPSMYVSAISRWDRAAM